MLAGKAYVNGELVAEAGLSAAIVDRVESDGQGGPKNPVNSSPEAQQTAR
jgi:hypothetical protein